MFWRQLRKWLVNMLLSISNGLNATVQFITVLLLFILVLGITYLTTRWIGNYQKGKVICNNIEIIETHRISPNKYIQIVRIGNRYVAMSVCKDTVTMLTDLDKDELQIVQATEQPDFKEIFDKVKNLKLKK